MIITTGDKAGEAVIRRAEALASRTGGIYVPRRHTPLRKMSRAYGDDDIIVVLDGGARLVRPGEEPMEFHPSMGFIRAKRILKGESDPMLDAASMHPGDSVLDCTAGLGTDTLVFSVKGGARFPDYGGGELGFPVGASDRRFGPLYLQRGRDQRSDAPHPGRERPSFGRAALDAGP